MTGLGQKPMNKMHGVNEYLRSQAIKFFWVGAMNDVSTDADLGEVLFRASFSTSLLPNTIEYS